MVETVRICPNCGSPHVQPSKNMLIGAANLMDSSSWECKDCEYSGVMPEGTPEEFEEADLSFEKADQQESLESETAGLSIGKLQIIFLILIILFYLILRII